MATIADNRPNALYMIKAPADRYAVWEKRLYINKIFEELALPWNSTANTKEIYNEIVAYSKAHNIVPRGASWDVIDNVLTVNGKPLKRVGPKECDYTGSDEADYWEDMILARQEKYMPD